MPDSIQPTTLGERLAGDAGWRLIDVRTPAEYHEVHVRGASNVPLDQLNPKDFADVQQPLYTICKSGSRGARACEKLAAAGIQAVNVQGGTTACVDAGLPVVRGKQSLSLERQVRIAAGLLVAVGAALAWLVHPAWVALPAFVGCGLIFAGVTDTCGMGMMLARMPWNQTSGCGGCET